MRSFGKEGMYAALSYRTESRLKVSRAHALLIGILWMAPWAWFAPPLFWTKRGVHLNPLEPPCVRAWALQRPDRDGGAYIAHNLDGGEQRSCVFGNRR